MPVPSRLHIAVDHARCVGNGMCLTFAPGVFAHNARRQSEVVDPEGDAVEDVIVAAENCPTGAIRCETPRRAKSTTSDMANSSESGGTRKFSVLDFARRKKAGEPIVMVTAYDALFASLVEAAGVDSILVGDSVVSVLGGESTTLSATVDQMIYHGRIVRRGAKRALVVVDMPFLSYQVSPVEAVRNGGRILKETGAGAVKLEGGADMAPAVEALVKAGVPVMGHLGFTPQSVHQLGGHRVQGRGEGALQKLFETPEHCRTPACSPLSWS